MQNRLPIFGTIFIRPSNKDNVSSTVENEKKFSNTHLYIIECLKFFIKRGIYAQINGTLFYRDQ